MTVVCLGKHRENKAGLVTGFVHGASPESGSQSSAHRRLASGCSGGIVLMCEE